MGMLEVSSWLAVAYAAAAFAIVVVWMIAARRLVRPGSWWDRHLHAPDKRLRVQRRYGKASA